MRDRALRVGKADVQAALTQAVGIERERIRQIGPGEVEQVSAGTTTGPTQGPIGPTMGMWPTTQPDWSGQTGPQQQNLS